MKKIIMNEATRSVVYDLPSKKDTPVCVCEIPLNPECARGVVSPPLLCMAEAGNIRLSLSKTFKRKASVYLHCRKMPCYGALCGSTPYVILDHGGGEGRGGTADS